MKILLIEDDKNLCEMLCFQLEKEHHTVEICMDGWTRRAGSGFAGCL